MASMWLSPLMATRRQNGSNIVICVHVSPGHKSVVRNRGGIFMPLKSQKPLGPRCRSVNRDVAKIYLTTGELNSLFDDAGHKLHVYMFAIFRTGY